MRLDVVLPMKWEGNAVPGILSCTGARRHEDEEHLACTARSMQRSFPHEQRVRGVACDAGEGLLWFGGTDISRSANNARLRVLLVSVDAGLNRSMPPRGKPF